MPDSCADQGAGCIGSRSRASLRCEPQPIFTWVSDPRYGPAETTEVPTFLPIEVTPNLPTVEPEHKRPDVPGLIKIVLANGHHLEISGAFDTDTVVRLAHGLSE